MTTPKVRACLLLAAAAFAAPALAQTTAVYYTADGREYYRTTTEEIYYTPAPAPVYTPVERVYYTEPPIIVTRPRETREQRITNDAIDVLASDTRISGVIGVQTNRDVVTLNGRVTTPGQARIATRDVQMVDGVREVRNELRTRVGGTY